jgi:hypothetical protein
MLARLGNVLYWAGCLFAVLILAAGVVALAMVGKTDGGSVLLVAFVAAALAWGIGRVCQYFLSGK